MKNAQQMAMTSGEIETVRPLPPSISPGEKIDELC
jgi:hypothetical protein